MKYIIYSIISISLLTACGSSAQEDEKQTTDELSTEQDTTATADTLAEEPYAHLSLHMQSEWVKNNADNPTFHSKRVDEWTDEKEKISETESQEMFYEYDLLKAAQLQKLTARELIYYYLAYPCSFSQNCAFDDYQDSTKTPKIKCYFPNNYEGSRPSALQQEYLQRNKDSVIFVITEFIKNNPTRVDYELLDILLDLNAISAIPAVMKASDENYNEFAYSFAVMIMQKNKYDKFMKSDIYPYLYGDDSYTYGNRVEASDENKKLISKLVLNMYSDHQ